MSNKTFVSRPFEKLKKRIASKEAASASPPVPPKKKDQLTDEELLRTAMSGVHEVKEFQALPFVRGKKKTAPLRDKANPDQEALTILSEVAAGHSPINLPDTQEYVEWVNPEYLGDLAQHLHAGQFSVQSFLDLHGYTVDEAGKKLEFFLKDALLRGLRCVKIIHGRGLRSPNGPVLKDVVTRRLSGHHRKDIMAYVTARQCDGGLGALYVLLRGRRRRS